VPAASIFFAATSLAVWLYLTLARGTFWLLSSFDDDEAKHASPPSWPRVAAIIPARNEAQTISQTIAALLHQNYPGEFYIIVVDDHSEDQTAQIAQEFAKENGMESRINIHPASTLPSGWTGKLWALSEGVSMSSASPLSSVAPASSTGTASSNMSSRAERGICFSPPADKEATHTAPTYFWFTDADVIHAPDTLRRLVARAEQNKLDLTSLMVLLRAKTLPERALIPAFLFFFLKLYPPRWIAAATARTAGAAGGCVLLRREALERIGGLTAIRSDVIDDCALARAVKCSGGKIWMGLTRASHSLRAYLTFAEIRDMIARTAFTQLHYSTFLLLGTLAGMFLTYLTPPALLFVHNSLARILALAAWLLMSLTFLPAIRFYRLSPLWTPLLPLAALFYAYATWLSALRYWLNRGGQWKGRAQAPRAI
jgi:cellulose synthase/poly-beta-1,6-N-acetylglucosamine synthase-like glycosyltransferase